MYQYYPLVGRTFTTSILSPSKDRVPRSDVAANFRLASTSARSSTTTASRSKLETGNWPATPSNTWAYFLLIPTAYMCFSTRLHYFTLLYMWRVYMKYTWISKCSRSVSSLCALCPLFLYSTTGSTFSTGISHELGWKALCIDVRYDCCSFFSGCGAASKCSQIPFST